jgi:hypothetical protein
MEMAEVSLRVIRVFPDGVIAAMLHTYMYSLILTLLLLEKQVFVAWLRGSKRYSFGYRGNIEL